MDKTVKKSRQNQPSIWDRVKVIIPALGVGRKKKRKRQHSYQGRRWGKARRNKGAFGKNPLKDYHRSKQL